MSKKFGFLFDIEVVDPKTGLILDRETVHNLTPTEGENHILNVVVKGAAPITSWYVMIYEGNYTPLASDTGATFPASATECTGYVESARQAFVPGTVVAGAVDNSASPANFTSNANKTIYGLAIVSASAKGATAQTLLSAVKFATAKNFDAGTLLRVTGGLALS